MRTLEKHTLGFGECTIKGGLESTGLEKGPVKGLCNRYIPQTRISDTTLAAAIGRYMKLASLLQCNLLDFFLCDTWEMPSRKVPFAGFAVLRSTAFLPLPKFRRQLCPRNKISCLSLCRSTFRKGYS